MRPRTKDRHLPACVYLKHGAYWYVKGGKWRKIGTDLHSALTEYARIVAAPTDGMPALIDAALPVLTKDVAESTRKQYEYCAVQLKEAFAAFYPSQVRHGDVVELLDGYADRQALANRMLTVLKLVFQWALDRGRVEANPCVSVKRFVQRPRDRLITPREYAAIYKECPPWLQCVMDLCYLTGQRIGDVLKIEDVDLREEGVFFEQQKTGKRLVVEWTPELRAAVERAKELQGSKTRTQYLLGGRGGKLRLHSNVWRIFKDAAIRANIPDVTLHDLRAMAGTDAESQGIDPSALLGHSDPRTTRIYLRDKRPKLVKGPTKRAV
ncbi:tyrosine-type recombinase/integrase [Achromobacter insolitus]|uniref:tyrosine-type recombinase/integrase n=1 Tax=Achromobacter insolitus TaxID=217204 RepID=UPI0028A5AB26|nr:tyrosine-type recombinase/integrase [Achromobacter insolitus]